MNVRRSEERGLGHRGWLKSRHTFSFADYHDPEHMGFRSLRVINEDHIAAGTGFGAHPHRDMEIITYVISGALSHQDSMGNSSVIRPNEVQKMSAGSGVVHSEHNRLSDNETHLLQIWITPNVRGGEPNYEQKSFAKELATSNLVLVVSRDGRAGSIAIKQDADIYLSRLEKGDTIAFQLRPGRGAWVQVTEGQIELNGITVTSGDGIAIENEPALRVKALDSGEILIFDLA